MFRKRVKIKQISAVAEAGLVFIFGLGSDGKIYSWRADSGQWTLNVTKKGPQNGKS